MVKTLRITSIVAALLAIAVFAFPVIYGVKTDENIQKFLNSPGILEKFKAISGNRVQTTTPQVNPLVQQSQAYALIINPPAPPAPSGGGTVIPGKTTVQILPPSTVQFTVESTSFCETNPALSLALINEPGKGTYWVRQAGTVNHQLIEQIKDGVVIVNNGRESVEIKIDEKKFTPAPAAGTKGVAKGAAAPSKTTVRPTTPVTPPPAPPSVPAKAPVVTQPPKTEPKTETDPEKAKKADELYEKIKLIGSATDDPNNPKSSMETKAAQIQKLITEYRSSTININEDEAKKLADLGEMLESVKNPPPEK